MDVRDDPKLVAALTRIEQRATRYDIEAAWPLEDLNDLRDVGAMRWAIEREFGGSDVDAVTLHDYYEHVASASLATAMLISQRDAGIGYIEASSNESLKQRLLPQLAEDKVWTTIGISHLTTSQHSGALMARRITTGTRQCFLLDGIIPWATGGQNANFIVAGARTDDEQQLLFVLLTDASGVIVNTPQRLATLAAAPTSSVSCSGVLIEPDMILSGPTEHALSGRPRALPLGQTFAAFGLVHAALKLIRKIDSDSSRSTYDTLTTQLYELHNAVRDANSKLDGHDLQSGPLLRSECNNLAVRSTHAAVTLYKGAALRLDHPAQRLAREALFLLVWSSPASVVDRNLELMSEPH